MGKPIVVGRDVCVMVWEGYVDTICFLVHGVEFEVV